MTVKELEEVLGTIKNKDMEVIDHYFDAVKGYYFRESSGSNKLVLSKENVKPRIDPEP